MNCEKTMNQFAGQSSFLKPVLFSPRGDGSMKMFAISVVAGLMAGFLLVVTLCLLGLVVYL
jgi:hypothetical protein